MRLLELSFRLFILSLALMVTSCASKYERWQSERLKQIETVSAGDVHRFKDWPGSDAQCAIQLSGVTRTDSHLGPDFSVHYFDFDSSSSLALYRGGHPRTRTSKPVSRFSSRFAGKFARWEVCEESGFLSAWSYVDMSKEDYPDFWHLMIQASTLEKVKQIARECESFKMTATNKL
jgi:hypothetical protein